MIELTERDQGVTFSVRVKPRAHRDAVLGEREGALEVSLRAAPVDGAANAALLELLADTLGVPRRNVSLLRGDTARNKVVRVEGVSAAQVRALVGGAARGGY